MQPDLVTMWTEYQPKLQQYIWRKTSDPELTEDLAAQVFVRAIEAIAQGKGPRSNESGWMYRIAHNLVVDHYRKCSRQRVVALEDYIPCQGTTPLESAELAFDIEALRSAMRRLTDEQAQVLQMRFLEGYSFGEIAEAMERTEGAVKALQHRALAGLREVLSVRLER